jgi:tRNA(Ile)-lysidine synthase
MVSGGSDSVALARLLPLLYPQCFYTILHVNHQMRGVDADEDERFVVALAQELGLSCEIRRADVAARAAKTGDNIEQLGRRVRYQEADALLDVLCARAGVDKTRGRIATAHTLDDRVETFFMRAIVGAGVGSFVSIPFVNGCVIRPLLDCSRQQLREWLCEHSHTYFLGQPSAHSCEQSSALPSDHLSEHSGEHPGEHPGEHSHKLTGELWREDATNEDTSRLRAFVRHEIIPRARSKNPALLPTIARSLDVLACEDALLTRLATMLEEAFVRERDGVVSIDTALFDEEQALVRRVVKAACNRVLLAHERITWEHIVRIAEQGHHVGFVTNITGAVTVANEYGTLVICRLTKTADRVDGLWSTSFSEEFAQLLPDGRTIELARVESQFFGDDPVAYARANANDLRVFIDAEALLCGGPVRNAGGGASESIKEVELWVSYLSPGDCFCPLGMGGHHKLVSDVLIDRKIPRRQRTEICKVSTTGDTKGTVVWIIGLCLDERFKVSDETTSMFSIIVKERKMGQEIL